MGHELTLTWLLRQFVRFYGRANKHDIKPVSTVNQYQLFKPFMEDPFNDRNCVLVNLNCGDSATAAIAVGKVFEAQTKESLIYKDNGTHCYLGYNDKWFDTLYPEGVKDESLMLGYDHTTSVLDADFTGQTTAIRYLTGDFYAMLIVCKFCAIYGVAFDQDHTENHKGWFARFFQAIEDTEVEPFVTRFKRQLDDNLRD